MWWQLNSSPPCHHCKRNCWLMILRSAHCHYCCAYILSLLIKHLFLTQVIEEVWWWVWKISVELNSAQLSYRNIHLCQSGIEFHGMKSSLKKSNATFYWYFRMLWLYWQVKGQPGNTETTFKACRSNHSVSGFFLPAAHTGCVSLFLYIYLFPNSTFSCHSKPAVSWFDYGFSCMH